MHLFPRNGRTISCKEYDNLCQLLMRIWAAQRGQEVIHKQPSSMRVCRAPHSSLSKKAPARCHQYAENRAPVQSVCEAKQEQAMFARMYLNLLVCGFKIKTCACERSMRVFWHESEAHVGCHWQADACLDIALGVHPAHARCNFIPAPPSLRTTHPLEISVCSCGHTFGEQWKEFDVRVIQSEQRTQQCTAGRCREPGWLGRAGLLPRKSALPLRTPGPTRVAQVCPS